MDGYVNAVCRDSKPLLSPQGLFVEQVKEGVFQKALNKAQDVRLLFNHDEKRELGSIKNGNLQLFEDSIGLRVICTVDDPEVVQKARENRLKGWSFGFYTNKDDWQPAEPYQRRFIEDMDLLEVSILDKTPVYNGTSIEARDDKEVLAETRGDNFQAVIVDLSQEPQEEAEQEPKVEEVEQEETREFYNAQYIAEILKLKQFR